MHIHPKEQHRYRFDGSFVHMEKDALACCGEAGAPGGKRLMTSELTHAD